MMNVLIWFVTVLVSLIASSEDDYRVVELGASVKLECSFPDSVTSITWQEVIGSEAINRTTCNVVENNCNDPDSTFDTWTISRSGNQITLHVTILSIRPGQTAFTCVADNGLHSNTTLLSIYTQPSKPECTHVVHEDKVVVSCTVDNIYPRFTAALHRRGVEIDWMDYEHDIPYDNEPSIVVRSFNITYTVFSDFALPQMVVYVEAIPVLSDSTVYKQGAVFSDDMFVNYSATVVALDSTRCPYGPGVSGNKILNGTTAYCKCDVQTMGYPPGDARWFTMEDSFNYFLHENETVDNTSSTLIINYDSTDQNRTYQCRAVSRLGGNRSRIFYRPTFYSSAQPMFITGLQALVFILGVIVSGLIASLN